MNKTYYAFVILSFVILLPSQSLSRSKSITICGTVACYQKDDPTDRPAECIVVVFKDRLESSYITRSTGYFEITLPYNDIIDKHLMMYFCDYNGFICWWVEYIDGAKVEYLGKRRYTYRIGRLQIGRACELFEEDQCISAVEYLQKLLKSRSRKHLFRSKYPQRLLAIKDPNGGMGPVEDWEPERRVTHVVQSGEGPFSFLGWDWATAAWGTGIGFGVAGVGGAWDDTDDKVRQQPPQVIEILDIESVSPKTNIDGRFLSLALDGMTRNVGFQFSPTRNMADSVFFNSSAISFSRYGQYNFHSDWQRYYQVSGCLPSEDGFGLGAGLLFLGQKETRTAVTESNENASRSFETDELGMFISASKRLRDDLSLGLTAKYISQKVQSPSAIRKVTTDHGGGNIEIHRDIVRSEDKEEYADFDLSATYRINPQYQLGFSFMNIAGTKLLTGDNEREEIRSFGTGLSYKNKRIHLGGDIILNHDGTADYSVGMNVVPFSNVEVNLGYGSAFDSFVVGAKYRVRKWKGIYIAPTYSFFRNNAFGEYHLIGLSANF